MAETIDIRELNERIERQSAFVTNLTTGMDQVIVGQKHLVESLLIGLLSDGHVLLEGVPGLAKTLAIKTLASLIDAQYSRIQFTPDLLPADVIGTMVYSQKDETFQVKKGPVFANFVLADEINRAPAKVQSALLEAMQERQVTIGNETFRVAQTIPGACHTESYRAGRYLSAARSASGPFHAESRNRLSEAGRGETDYPSEYQW